MIWRFVRFWALPLVVVMAMWVSDYVCAQDLTERNPERAKEVDAAEDLKSVEPSVTHHMLKIADEEIKYTATAGFIGLRKPETDEKKREKYADFEEFKTIANVFYVAYTKEGMDPSERPLLFSFNGGPGASSIWLHMGGLGPKRIVLTERGESLPPPPRYEDNPESWLDRADLVFIDPVSTGFSRAAPGEDPKQFYGYWQDIESVAEFIRLYLTQNERWASPKFIIGESYGTTRAAGLSEYLQSQSGINLNGIVLVSSVLNFQTIDVAPGNDAAYPLFLPSYTATAWYHKKLASELQSMPLEDVIAKSEEYASGDYLHSLFRGDNDVAGKHVVAREIGRYTGLSEQYIVLRNLRITPAEFRSRLLNNEGRMVGRFDGRFSGWRLEPGTDGTEFDPSFEAVNGPMTAAFNDYIRRELKFKSTLQYETIADVSPWKFSKADNQYLDVVQDLREAMLKNPYLKVWICGGYFDLATPYFAARYTANQAALPEPIRANLSVTIYPAGHMLYLDKSVLRGWKADFVKYLKSAFDPGIGAVESAKR